MTLTQNDHATALRLLKTDRELLTETMNRVPHAEWSHPTVVTDGVLGHFCETLHDLVGHILMWDEIAESALFSAQNGAVHWSLEALWESPDAGRQLNVAGVAAARHLEVGLLEDRFRSHTDAIVRHVERLAADWDRPFVGGVFNGTVGGLVSYVMSPPDGAPFGHVAKHLDAATLGTTHG